jgi:hypothetical protein
MPVTVKQPKPEGPIAVVDKKPPCRCGSTKAREVSRIDNAPGVSHSIMYECVECGEYRL